MMFPIEYLPKYLVGQDKNRNEKLEISTGQDTLVLSNRLFLLDMSEYYKQKISFISKSVNIVFD